MPRVVHCWHREKLSKGLKWTVKGFEKLQNRDDLQQKFIFI